MIECLDVMLWGRKVGTLVASREKYRERICFYFARSCIDKAVDAVRNYPEYAVKTGVDRRWTAVIHTEILSRIKHLDE